MYPNQKTKVSGQYYWKIKFNCSGYIIISSKVKHTHQCKKKKENRVNRKESD